MPMQERWRSACVPRPAAACRLQASATRVWRLWHRVAAAVPVPQRVLAAGVSGESCCTASAAGVAGSLLPQRAVCTCLYAAQVLLPILRRPQRATLLPLPPRIRGEHRAAAACLPCRRHRPCCSPLAACVDPCLCCACARPRRATTARRQRTGATCSATAGARASTSSATAPRPTSPLAAPAAACTRQPSRRPAPRPSKSTCAPGKPWPGALRAGRRGCAAAA